MSPRVKRRKWPAMWLFFCWIALLFIVLAAAKLGMTFSGGFDGDISIILDRGATMPRGAADHQVFQELVSRVGRVADTAKVTLLPIPGQAAEMKGMAWASVAAAMPPTAVDTQRALETAVARQLRNTRGRVIVLSDQTLPFSDARVSHIFPKPAAPSVAITAFSARASPFPQVMVRLENQTDQRTVRLRIQSGEITVMREVDLPPKDQSKIELINLPKLDSVISAEIIPHKTNDAWAQAWLSRRSAGSTIIVDEAMSPGIKRIADIYAKDRPAVANAHAVIITNHALDAGQCGAWIDDATAISNQRQDPLVVPHPITRGVNLWPAADDTVQIPDGFKPVVSIGRKIAVAVRDEPARQLWLNADLRNWETTADFVIFFGNVFDWLGGTDLQYAAEPPVHLGDQWMNISPEPTPFGTEAGEWPGIYRSSTGHVTAISVGKWPAIGHALKPSSTNTPLSESALPRTALLADAIYAALACLILAALKWPGASRYTN